MYTLFTHVCILYTYVYIYIYIYTGRERERDLNLYLYIYIQRQTPPQAGAKARHSAPQETVRALGFPTGGAPRLQYDQ